MSGGGVGGTGDKNTRVVFAKGEGEHRKMEF